MRMYSLITVIVLMVCGCNSNEAAIKNFDIAPDTTYLGETDFSTVQLVRKAELHLHVPDVQWGADSLSNLTEQFGGYVYNRKQYIETIQERSLSYKPDSVLSIKSILPHASLTVRVPVHRLDRFIEAVQLPAAAVEKLEIHAEDKTIEHTAQGKKEENRQKLLTEIPKKITASAAQKKIVIGDEATDQWQAQQQIEFDAAYSMVTINLSQNKLVLRSVVANTYLDALRPPLGQRLKDAWGKGGMLLVDLTVLTFSLWPLLLLTAAAYTTYRLYKKKSATPALIK